MHSFYSKGCVTSPYGVVGFFFDHSFRSPFRTYILHIDKIIKELSNLYSKVLRQSRFLINDVFLSLKITFVLANNADHDEMSLYAHFILIFRPTVCQSTSSPLSRMKKS